MVLAYLLNRVNDNKDRYRGRCRNQRPNFSVLGPTVSSFASQQRTERTEQSAKARQRQDQAR
jgi:hypothetical protein